MRARTRAGVLLVLAAASPCAWSHGLEAAGFLAGLAHPIGGPDHLLAMVAVGIASTRGGRSLLWGLPATFLVAMVAGFLCGLAGVRWMGAEQGVAVPVVLLGLLVAGRARWLPHAASVAVLVFGWCHGYAHGCEWPTRTSPWGFAVGFLGTTVGLHAIGVLTGLLYREQPQPHRFFLATGLAVSAAGAGMAILRS